MGRQIETIPAEAMDALMRDPWPGNVRELENVIECAVILSPGPTLSISIADLIAPAASTASTNGSASTLADVERDHIIRARGFELGAGWSPRSSRATLNEAHHLAVEDQKIRDRSLALAGLSNRVRCDCSPPCRFFGTCRSFGSTASAPDVRLRRGF